jgi:hypothetical protein
MPGNANLPIGSVGGPAWHSRGYIPHFERADLIQHVAFHLADSMAKEAVERMDAEITRLPLEEQDAERRTRVEQYIHETL